jgi:hypothetical protein
MANVNDDQVSSLVAQGYSGTRDDMMLQWALANGGTAPNVNDAVLQVLVLDGATTANLNDAWYQVLGTFGATGGVPERMAYFWGTLSGFLNILSSWVLENSEDSWATEDAEWKTEDWSN